jgi:hypothetical protein
VKISVCVPAALREGCVSLAKKVRKLYGGGSDTFRTNSPFLPNQCFQRLGDDFHPHLGVRSLILARASDYFYKINLARLNFLKNSTKV